jgi:hypothetical protein
MRSPPTAATPADAPHSKPSDSGDRSAVAHSLSADGRGSGGVVERAPSGEDGAPAAAPPAATPSGTGSAPARQPCDLPGRSAWMMWRTLFVLDDRYVPIKVWQGERDGEAGRD